MRTKHVLALSAVVLALAPCSAQVEGEPAPLESTAESGGERSIDIVIELGNTEESLGSYGASLSWDPAILQFTGLTGGDPPFETPVVNTNDVAIGLLAFADASPDGSQGRTRLLTVIFDVVAAPPALAQLDLAFSSLFEAAGFEDLLPQLEVQDGVTCVADFAYDLQVSNPLDTTLEWTAIPQAVVYDVIRGDLGSLWMDGGSVHLATVDCLEDDSLDPTTGAGTEPSNPDTEVPDPGEGFFYLVRFHDGTMDRTYGYFNDCARERSVDSGDCD